MFWPSSGRESVWSVCGQPRLLVGTMHSVLRVSEFHSWHKTLHNLSHQMKTTHTHNLVLSPSGVGIRDLLVAQYPYPKNSSFAQFKQPLKFVLGFFKKGGNMVMFVLCSLFRYKTMFIFSEWEKLRRQDDVCGVTETVLFPSHFPSLLHISIATDANFVISKASKLELICISRNVK